MRLILPSHLYTAAVIISLLIHGVFMFSFSLKFPEPLIPVKPSFIFLGSFLSPQDFSLSPVDKSNNQMKSTEHVINLDIRPSISRKVEKPQWMSTSVITSENKTQFKPLMKNELLIKKASNGADMPDMSFESIKPVRMELNSDD